MSSLYRFYMKAPQSLNVFVIAWFHGHSEVLSPPLKVWKLQKGASWRGAFGPCRLEARRVLVLWGIAPGWGTP